MAITVALSTNTAVKKDTQPIRGLNSLSFGLGTVEDVDVTDFGNTDNYRKYAPGMKDGDTVTLSGDFDPKDTGQLAVLADAASSTSDTYNIELAQDVVFTFTGYPKPPTIGADLGGKQTVEYTFKVSGKPVLTDDVTAIF